MKKEYLGDSVYAEIENGMVKLTTENGYGPSNTIYLEAFVIKQLVRFHDAAVAEYTQKIIKEHDDNEETINGSKE